MTAATTRPAIFLDFVINECCDFHEISNLWRHLEQKCDIYVFQKWAWAQTWLNTIAKSVRFKPHFLVVTVGAEPVGLFPFGIIKKRRVLSALSWLGGGFADYNLPLLAKTLDESQKQKIIGAVLDYAKKSYKCDLFMINNNPQTASSGEGNFILSSANLESFQYIRKEPAPYIRLLPWDAYYASVKKSIKADAVRQKKRLNELGELKFIVATELPEALELTRKMIEQKAQRYKQMGVTNIFADPAYSDFFVKLTQHYFQEGWIQVSALYLGTNPVAIHWGYYFNKRLYFIMPSYQYEYQKYSVGRLHMEYLIKWCCENGAEIFDFCNGADAYKDDWAKSEMKVVDLLSCESVSGRLARPFLKGFKAITRKAS